MPSPAAESTASRSSGPLLARLAAMMFLLYWSFGIWVVTVGTYIAANTEREGRGIFSAGFIGYSAVAGAIGSVLSPGAAAGSRCRATR